MARRNLRVASLAVLAVGLAPLLARAALLLFFSAPAVRHAHRLCRRPPTRLQRAPRQRQLTRRRTRRLPRNTRTPRATRTPRETRPPGDADALADQYCSAHPHPDSRAVAPSNQHPARPTRTPIELRMPKPTRTPLEIRTLKPLKPLKTRPPPTHTDAYRIAIGCAAAAPPLSRRSLRSRVAGLPPDETADVAGVDVIDRGNG